MPRRIAKTDNHRFRHFIKEWRKFRQLNQEQLAERIGTSVASVSRIESGKQPYTQDFLEAAAGVLNTSPGSLVMRNPEGDDALWTLWEQAQPGERQQLIEMARVIVRSRTGTDS
jgi:transcriptional regulator with XRE-family HTH domain